MHKCYWLPLRTYASHTCSNGNHHRGINCRSSCDNSHPHLHLLCHLLLCFHLPALCTVPQAELYCYPGTACHDHRSGPQQLSHATVPLPPQAYPYPPPQPYFTASPGIQGDTAYPIAAAPTGHVPQENTVYPAADAPMVTQENTA